MWGEPRRPISRVLYPLTADGDHLSSLPDVNRAPLEAGDVTIEVEQPTRGRAGRPLSPYSALLQVGFGRCCVTADSRTLLPSDFTLPSTDRGGMFLCHFPSPPAVPEGPGCYPAPCPEEPGLSSPPATYVPGAAVTRSTGLPPSGTLAYRHMRVKVNMK